uniref:Uncharacterized protein n=1 Tax=Anopheles coluzzii TaxID=1518534 RepID=A0A8W7PG43_ANOCL
MLHNRILHSRQREDELVGSRGYYKITIAGLSQGPTPLAASNCNATESIAPKVSTSEGSAALAKFAVTTINSSPLVKCGEKAFGRISNAFCFFTVWIIACSV